MRTPISISNVMTPDPHTIGRTLPIESALEIMNKYRLLHLPVLDRGCLVGVLSDIDLRELPFDRPETLRKLKVEDLMTHDPFTVSPDAPLGEVAGQMTDSQLQCAVVCQDPRTVLGIFTVRDALRVLKEALTPISKPPRKGSSRKKK